MPLVVDASVARAWALPDEGGAYADAVLAVVERDGLRLPELWAREIANGLAVAYLRKRITSVDERAFLTALSHLIEKVILAAVIDEPVGVVHPVPGWREVKLRAEGLVVRTIVPKTGRTLGNEQQRREEDQNGPWYPLSRSSIVSYRSAWPAKTTWRRDRGVH